MVTTFQFKTRFPEFAPVQDGLLGLVLEEVASEVGEAWLSPDRNRATMLLAAHRLTLEGEPGRSLTGQGAAGSGLIKRDKVGDVETEFATPTDTSGNGFGMTAYGREFLLLRARSFPAVWVV